MSEQKYQFSQPLRIQLDVKVPMTDGVNLSTDIYLPPEGGPFPTLLVRTIYDNQADWCIDMAKRAVPQGYAVVMQDCRGRFDSDGEFSPYFQEPEDGYDTQEWIGAQEWCDGNIGMFGSSYIGYTPVDDGTTSEQVPQGAGSGELPAGQLRPLAGRRAASAPRRHEFPDDDRTDDAARVPEA